MKSDELDRVRRPDAEHGEPLDGIIRGLREAQGLDISAYDGAFLRAAIAMRLQANGHRTAEGYGRHLLAHRMEAEAFCRSLRVSHSGFFRNPLTFALLEQRILPALIAEKKHAGGGEIRVWSAGCAAGQEAWSVAILLDELTRGEAPPQAYRIFASDLSETDLEVARAGVYNADAVGNVRTRHLGECFTRQGESHGIVPRLRDRVDFSAYDLLDEGSSSPQASIYGDFDLILCCNLLFYYRPSVQRRILDKLCRDLVPGGYLVTGEAERQIVAARDGLRAVAPPVEVFQKIPGIPA